MSDQTRAGVRERLNRVTLISLDDDEQVVQTRAIEALWASEHGRCAIVPLDLWNEAAALLAQQEGAREPDAFRWSAVEVRRGEDWTWQCQANGSALWDPDEAEAEAAAWREDGYEAQAVRLYRLNEESPPSREAPEPKP